MAMSSTNRLEHADRGRHLDHHPQLGDEEHHQEGEHLQIVPFATVCSMGTEEVAAPGLQSPLSDRAAKRADRRLFPRTVLGLSVLLFFMGIAAAFSGAVLYAYYESRQEQTVNKVDNFVGGFSEQLDAAKQDRPGRRRQRQAGHPQPARRAPEVRRQRFDAHRPARQGAAVGVVREHARPERGAVGRLGLRGVLRRQAVVPADVVHHDPGGDTAAGPGGHVAQARRGGPRRQRCSRGTRPTTSRC